MSKSQLKQDLNVLEYYNFKKRGYFVDIGASDGISLSNTYMLEKDYNWNGICVEPILNDFNILISNRKNSICVNKAVYNISDTKMKFAIKNFNMCSGLIETMDNQVIIDNKVYDSCIIKEIYDLYKANPKLYNQEHIDIFNKVNKVKHNLDWLQLFADDLVNINSQYEQKRIKSELALRTMREVLKSRKVRMNWENYNLDKVEDFQAIITNPQDECEV